MMANFQLISTPDQLTPICPLLAGQRAIGVDTETTSLDPLAARVRLLQLSTPGMVYILDLFQVSTSALAPIKEILEAERPVKALHNAKFDAKMLRHHFGIELTALFDTMLASQLVSAGDVNQRHGLSDLAVRYVGQRMEKTLRASDWSGPLSEAMLDYAADDGSGRHLSGPSGLGTVGGSLRSQGLPVGSRSQTSPG
jgi:DNA polymerase-1